MLHGIVVFRSRLGGNYIRHAMHQFGVPRGRQPNRLRKYGRRPRARHAVQRLAPPVVSGHTQPRNRRRVILHLGDFFFERHARGQISYALFEREIGVEVRGFTLFPVVPGRCAFGVRLPQRASA